MIVFSSLLQKGVRAPGVCVSMAAVIACVLIFSIPTLRQCDLLQVDDTNGGHDSNAESPPLPDLVVAQIAKILNQPNLPSTPVLPPLPREICITCDNPPDRAEIMRVMSRPFLGIPFHCGACRTDLEFSVETIVDTIDPPRFFPMIGPAQLHHCHWKCTVFYSQVISFNSLPIPPINYPCREVVFFDRSRIYPIDEGSPGYVRK